MPEEPSVIGVPAWRSELPPLTGRVALLREPTTQDLGPLVDLLSLGDATRFGLDEPVSEVAVQELIERFARERASGLAFTYAITLATARTIVGLVQVRQARPRVRGGRVGSARSPLRRAAAASFSRPRA